MNSNIRSYQRKKLVSYLREDDYAHAGEVEAILLVMNKFAKHPSQAILDVGCGLGGTANYIQKNGWGKVTGIDIEAESINYARTTYPDVEFYLADATHIQQTLKEKKFDLIYMFNAFYAFHNQKAALFSVAEVAKPHAKLAIFDYADPLKNERTPLFKEGDENTTSFKPIKIQDISELFSSTPWKVSEIVDVSDDYIRWYKDLVEKIVKNKEFIIKEFGNDAYNHAYKLYTEIRDSAINKTLGGVIIYAEKITTH